MQTTRIPEANYEQRISMGNKDDNKSQHLVAGEKVCKAKKEGEPQEHEQGKYCLNGTARMVRKILSSCNQTHYGLQCSK